MKIALEFFKIENELEFHTYGLRLLYKIKFEELGKVVNNFLDLILSNSTRTCDFFVESYYYTFHFLLLFHF